VSLASIVGSRSRLPSVEFVLDYVISKAWVHRTRWGDDTIYLGATRTATATKVGELRLMFAGWERFEELRRAKSDKPSRLNGDAIQ
jgi:hypothetical protein